MRPIDQHVGIPHRGKSIPRMLENMHGTGLAEHTILWGSCLGHFSLNFIILALGVTLVDLLRPQSELTTANSIKFVEIAGLHPFDLSILKFLIFFFR